MTEDEIEQQTAKAVMRIQMRALRRKLMMEHPEADWQAGDHAEALLRGLKLPATGVAAIYKAAGAEMDPRPLGENLVKLGWRLALPVCHAVESPVIFRAYSPGDALAPDVMNIAAPTPEAETLDPDIIVCPVLAFDAVGGRLGQGGGYYDRTLEALRAGPKSPVFIALAFAGQEVERVPLFAHDQRLDAVLTETGYRRFS